MNTKIQESVSLLTSITIDTTDVESLTSAVIEQKEEVIEALQFIGDGDFEGYLEATHLTLYKVCPKELESHVAACNGFWTGIINNAWNDFEHDVAKAFNSFLELDNEEESVTTSDDDTINHLTKCLNLEVSTPVQPIWSF